MKTLRDEKCRTALVERLNAVTADSKPSWGRMNVEQMLSHLVQTSELPFVSSVADRSSWLSRTLVKPLVLYVLPMPRDVKIGPDVDQLQSGRKPAGLDADRARAAELINKLGTLPLSQTCLAHPFFGRMSARQWAVLAHKHIDHHLRQFGV